MLVMSRDSVVEVGLAGSPANMLLRYAGVIGCPAGSLPACRSIAMSNASLGTRPPPSGNPDAVIPTPVVCWMSARSSAVKFATRLLEPGPGVPTALLTEVAPLSAIAKTASVESAGELAERVAEMAGASVWK